MKTFEIPGIPTYMVYDRQGKQLARYLGFPGVDEIRKTIEKGL
jgi:thiol:disulfide interchange protein